MMMHGALLSFFSFCESSIFFFSCTCFLAISPLQMEEAIASI